MNDNQPARLNDILVEAAEVGTSSEVPRRQRYCPGLSRLKHLESLLLIVVPLVEDLILVVLEDLAILKIIQLCVVLKEEYNWSVVLQILLFHLFDHLQVILAFIKYNIDT